MTQTQVTALGVGAALLLAVLLLAGATAAVRRNARSRELLEARLAASQREVAQLADAVAGLARQVHGSRRAADAEREYVITTLSDAADAAELTSVPPRQVEPRMRPVTGTAVVEALEEQAVARLSEVDTSRAWGGRVAEVGVKALAFGHGLRRALSEENRDRAAAEAHVARRRSRRTRRQELREARRLVRAVRAQRPVSNGAEPARSTEDAA